MNIHKLLVSAALVLCLLCVIAQHQRFNAVDAQVVLPPFLPVSRLRACYSTGSAQFVLIALNLQANVRRIGTRLYSVSGELIPPTASPAVPPAVVDGTAVFHRRTTPRTLFVAADMYVKNR